MSNARQESNSQKNIFSFFKPTSCEKSKNDTSLASTHIGTAPTTFDDSTFIWDPALRIQIWEQPVNKREEFRRKFIKAGPYKPILQEYKAAHDGKQLRRFQSSWFIKFSWLEYSPEKNRAFCFPCFLFETNPPSRPAFTIDGFNAWKRVSGPKCAFLQHVGGLVSTHFSNVQAQYDLMNSSRHIERVLNAQSKEMVMKNQLHLKTTIGCIRCLAFQGCSFRGHDESPKSRNRGNFLELVKFSAMSNEKVAEVILENAPKNAKYTSLMIQKEVLHILGDAVRCKIREEVRMAPFCILVDEAQDASNREQMAIVLRFVDKSGLLWERFFGITSVKDTTVVTLKEAISEVLDFYDLQIHDMRSQGYDGASNMRGAWNGLQALFMKECPYAYYVHCFAHQLQLALVVASKDVHELWLFYSKLNSIVNLFTASPKRHGELQLAQEIEFVNQIGTGEVETGRGATQIKTLQRAGATRWSSHFRSVSSLIDLFAPSRTIIENLITNGQKQSIRAEAMGVYEAMGDFKFIFILHLLNEMMGIIDLLCQAMQQKSQDIVNAMNLVSTIKSLLQKLRENGWCSFFSRVESFCKEQDIDMPDMSAYYKMGTGRSCQQRDTITVNHYYQFDLFNAAIDFQLMELNRRFSEGTVELLILSSALNPKDAFKSFKIEDICNLAQKFYPVDFTKDDLRNLRRQLQHYELDVPHHQIFQKMSTISELCEGLAETNKNKIYHLIDRLIRLVLTLPISTATTERAFSAMKHVKTMLHNKMEDDFLEDCMILNIERELAEDINLDLIVADFDSLKKRRVPLR